jgi:hypothetical protein
MKHSKSFTSFFMIGFIINVHGQMTLSNPSVPGLRDNLLAIVGSWKNNFSGQKINKVTESGDVFYRSSFHILEKDDPKIYDIANDNMYINTLQGQMTKSASANMFKKWQDLVGHALPDYDTLLSKDNAETQIKNFFCHADRNINTRLIRTKHQDGWAVVLVICHTDKFDRAAINKAIEEKQLSPDFKETKAQQDIPNFNNLVKMDLKLMATELNLKDITSTYKYPSPEALRKSFQNIIKAKESNFKDIKAEPLDKRGNSQYYRSTIHIIDGDDPQISGEPNPADSYYLNYLTPGLDDTTSEEIYNKWLVLAAQAMPEYNSTLPVKEYPEIKIHNFFSPLPDPVKIIFYRAKSKDIWRISITIKTASNDEIKRLQIEEAPAIMKETIQLLLKGRNNNFTSFKENELSSKGAVIKKYSVHGTLFPSTKLPVEFIEEDVSGKTTYTAIITGYPGSSTAIDAFEAAAGLMADKNYKLIKKEQGTKKVFSITYRGLIIAEGQLVTDQLEATIRIYGN